MRMCRTKLGVIVNASNGNSSHPDAKPDDGKDPSSAWQTKYGEWRFVTGGTPIVYGSMDFKNWYAIGKGFTDQKSGGENGGDCPSLFRLPPPTPGSGPAANASQQQPTHVHMSFGGFMLPGFYDSGPPQHLGTWREADPKTHRKSDHGIYYATKDFWVCLFIVFVHLFV